MILLSFIERFPDEASCKRTFKAFRDTQGVVCKKCGHENHYWLKNKDMYECKKCRSRQSLKSGTVMYRSQLPYKYWFIAMHLLTSTKKSFSALELQRQLGHKYYEPIWAMLHKLRAVMGKRDSNYQLDQIIELDEGFFRAPEGKPDKNEDETLKRGRGSQKQAKVLVMASSKVSMDRKKDLSKYKKPTVLKYIKMHVIDDLQGSTIEEKVKTNIKQESVVKTDDFRSYSKLDRIVWRHFPSKTPKEKLESAFPWIHTMISNAKRNLLGINHMTSKKYLQNYLNEFCYKFNRRYFGDMLFDRLLLASVVNTWKD
jgi:transposase-like protein